MSDMIVPATTSVLCNNSISPARYISWAIKALICKGPIVGKLKTIETIAEPEINIGIINPIELTNGFRANLTGYFQTTLL